MIKRIAIYLALALLIFIGADRALTQQEMASFGVEFTFPIEPMSLTGNFVDAIWTDIAWGDSGVLPEDGADYFRDLNVNIGGYASASLEYVVSALPEPINGYTNLVKAHGDPGVIADPEDDGVLAYFNGHGTPAGGEPSLPLVFTEDTTGFYHLVLVTVPDIPPGTYNQVFTWTLIAN